MCKSFKTFLAIMFFSIWLIPNSFVSAAENKIESIDIDIELQENGSAEIHEYREMDNKEDSEIFIELSNLGASELTGFEVDGFEEVKDWDIDASIDEKANRYSVIEKDDGYELVWGIGEYGLNTYDLTYGLTGLVRNLEDGQTLFWNFDSFLSFPTDQMNLTIRTDFDLKEKLLDYYAFGFEGPIDINEEGVLEWTGESLDESNDITILLQFPENTFQTDIKEDMTLDEQKEMALEGSSYNESEPMSTGIKIFIGMIVVLGTAFGVTGIAYLVKTNKIKKENDHFDIYQFIKKNRN
ncbi:MAG: DUF2207 domain-containing protein, partial [Atopostipes sp.]|nr:DUF2207 domain-containing protein [Atopostipes sp.]